MAAASSLASLLQFFHLFDQIVFPHCAFILVKELLMEEKTKKQC